MTAARFAIVTPYYKEQRTVLERCLESVAQQSVPADHILVADGFAQDWLDQAGVRHLRLDRAHGDFGNVARGLGAMLAVADGYDGIGFLDADNWLDKDHVAVCTEAGANPDAADMVIARRRLVRPDGSVMPILEDFSFIDTNCYWYRPGAYTLISYWATMPAALALIGDRVMAHLIRSRQLRSRIARRQTVNYTCLTGTFYRLLGEEPPPDAKPPVDKASVYRWLLARNEDERGQIARLTGIDMVAQAHREIARLARTSQQGGGDISAVWPPLGA